MPEKDKKHLRSVTGKKVYQYDMNYNLIRVYESTRETKEYGFDYGGVGRCCRGEYRQYKGYIWSYKEVKKVV